MPLYTMKEVWTPLRWMGVKFFKTLEDGEYYVKMGSKSRKKLNKMW